VQHTLAVSSRDSPVSKCLHPQRDGVDKPWSMSNRFETTQKARNPAHPPSGRLPGPLPEAIAPDAIDYTAELVYSIGVPAELLQRWSSRRAAIEARTAELSKQFQATHGREPINVEAIALAQQATLELREAKPEPRSLAERRHTWRTECHPSVT
jgi:phosphoenolpyruvate carboxylase